ncbi:hypothetical protein QEW_4687 [Clostridioides difficile CD160]|uniref:hypothetical protein n=1 Tax=unclassified Clostridioides TaxID=2635829 RepID=UPI00038D5408|nr:hypothetical protein QEW_4687 [Clostridioides difficile CD160]
MFNIEKFWKNNIEHISNMKRDDSHKQNDLNKYITVEEYNFIFTQLVKQKIIEKVNLDENNLNLTEKEKNRILNNNSHRNKLMFSRYEAEVYFSERTDIDKNSLTIEYRPQDIENLSIMYDSISDIDKKSDMEADKYIEENKEDIFIEILQLKEIKKELQLLRNSANILKFIANKNKTIQSNR